MTMAQAGEPLLHPLVVALLVLDQSQSNAYFSASAIITMLGYIARQDEYSVSYIQPSLDVMASRIWQGAAHMESVISLLSKEDGHEYPVTVHVSVTGKSIDGAIAKLVWALGALWFLLLLGSTFTFFRPTFGDSLISYVTARLLVEHPALVDRYCCSSLDENMQMTAGFETAGDSKIEEIVGHVTSGGEGILQKNRNYAGIYRRH